MGTNKNETHGSSAADPMLLDEAESLIWISLDGQLDAEGQQRLDRLLAAHPAMQQRYQSCCDLHVNLQQIFGTSVVRSSASPVLGQLAEFGPSQLGSLGPWTPLADS
jgi:hypothetical protein